MYNILWHLRVIVTLGPAILSLKREVILSFEVNKECLGPQRVFFIERCYSLFRVPFVTVFFPYLQENGDSFRESGLI